ncbi:Protein of unknown function [Gryllus bimaculatus]|nr:Protein of unknown function [Gryllus bimaculatus]
MVSVSDGKSRPQPMRLHLSMEVLKLQKEAASPVNHNCNSRQSPVDARVRQAADAGNKSVMCDSQLYLD